MLRQPARPLFRSIQSSLAPARTTTGRRFISTEPPHLRSRSWKSSAARWGIAIAGIYYYNTSPVFAEQPQHNLLNPNLDALESTSESNTLEALTSHKRNRPQNAAAVHAVADALSSENASTSVSAIPDVSDVVDTPGPGTVSDLEEEAEGEGAFNPVTGEINWDCPCLGGMAHGPCGPEFREAFSCFVFSQEEPKGMDCIDKFQGMRECFQEHPEVYKDELQDDDEMDEALEEERRELAKEIKERKDTAAAAVAGNDTSSQQRTMKETRQRKETAAAAVAGNDASSQQSTPKEPKSVRSKPTPGQEKQQAHPNRSEEQETQSGAKSHQPPAARGITSSSAGSEEDELVPKAAHDATAPTAHGGRKSEK